MSGIGANAALRRGLAASPTSPRTIEHLAACGARSPSPDLSLVARMERSAIRGRPFRRTIPRITLRSIRATRPCVARRAKHPNCRSMPRRQKYSTLPKFGNGVCVAATRPKEEGRIAIVTNAGRTAVDVGHIGAKGFAGRATVSEDRRAHDRCDPRTAKSCGPDARGLCVKSCGDACGPTGRSHQPSARRRGQ